MANIATLSKARQNSVLLLLSISSTEINHASLSLRQKTNKMGITTTDGYWRKESGMSWRLAPFAPGWRGPHGRYESGSCTGGPGRETQQLSTNWCHRPPQVGQEGRTSQEQAPPFSPHPSWMFKEYQNVSTQTQSLEKLVLHDEGSNCVRYILTGLFTSHSHSKSDSISWFFLGLYLQPANVIIREATNSRSLSVPLWLCKYKKLMTW